MGRRRKEEDERIAVYYDCDRADTIRTDEENLCKVINNDVAQFLGKYKLEFCAHNIELAINGKAELLDSVEQITEKGLQYGLPEFIRSQILKDVRMNAGHELEAVRRKCKRRTLEYMIIEGNCVRVDVDAIKEDCTKYIYTENEKKAYERHLAACKALNDYFGDSEISFWQVHFRQEKGKFVPNDYVLINYEFMGENSFH